VIIVNSDDKKIEEMMKMIHDLADMLGYQKEMDKVKSLAIKMAELFEKENATHFTSSTAICCILNYVLKKQSKNSNFGLLVESTLRMILTDLPVKMGTFHGETVEQGNSSISLN
jgi:hypothetical protein